jgi:hypothetical protein
LVVAVAVVAASGLMVLPAGSAQSVPLGCSPDPSPQIAALPVGGTFNGSGCYLIPNGIQLTKPVTIDGGAYYDLSAGPYPPALKPVVQIKDTHDVTIENVALIGGNPDGGSHARLANQHGVEVLSSDRITLSNVSTSDTFGDGLKVFKLPQHPPVTNLVVTNLTVTRAGRHGIVLASVEGATLTGINLVSSAVASWDFESGVKGVGASNVTVSDCTFTRGLYLIEYFGGPVSFTNCSGGGHVEVGSVNSQAPLTYTGGSFVIAANTPGYPPAAIFMKGGNLTFRDVAFTRKPSKKPPTGPAWRATVGANLTFVRSPVPPPLGTNDATSTVTIVP